MGDRPETGAMKFEGDWTGVFLRGDNALGYGLALKALLDSLKGEDHDVLQAALLQGLVEILFSCNESPPAPENALDIFTAAVHPNAEQPGAQKLKRFEECLAKPNP